MTRFIDLPEEEKEKQRAVVRDLIGHGPHTDDETIDMVIQLEEDHEGADKLNYATMATGNNGEKLESEEGQTGIVPSETEPSEENGFDFGDTISKQWERYKRNASVFGNYLKEGIKETVLPATYAAHRVGEVLFEPENLEGDAFENKMRGILAAGAYPDGLTPTYKEAQWLWRNGGGKDISVERKLYDQLIGVGSMIGSPSNSVSQNYENLRVMGNEEFPLEKSSAYDFEPFEAEGYSPVVFFRNLLNKIAIAEHGEGQEFEFTFR